MNQTMAKGASEDRLAHLLICWRRTPGSPETFLPAAMDGRDWLEKESHWGSTEVDLVVVVVVVVVFALSYEGLNCIQVIFFKQLFV